MKTCPSCSKKFSNEKAVKSSPKCPKCRTIDNANYNNVDHKEASILDRTNTISGAWLVHQTGFSQNTAL